MMDGAIILLKNLHKEMISILKLKMLFLDGEMRLQIMLKMKKKEVDGMIIKTIFNLRKDQKIIFKVELVEVKEELKEEEEIENSETIRGLNPIKTFRNSLSLF